jgi:hypothetical protein
VQLRATQAGREMPLHTQSLALAGTRSFPPRNDLDLSLVANVREHLTQRRRRGSVARHGSGNTRPCSFGFDQPWDEWTDIGITATSGAGGPAVRIAFEHED